MLPKGTTAYWPFTADADIPTKVTEQMYPETKGSYDIIHTAKNPSGSKAWCRYTTDVIGTFLSLG